MIPGLAERQDGVKGVEVTGTGRGQKGREGDNALRHLVTNSKPAYDAFITIIALVNYFN